MADDGELAAARRRAVDDAIEKLRVALSREPVDPATKVDTIRLPDGRYRAFVRAMAAVR